MRGVLRARQPLEALHTLLPTSQEKQWLCFVQEEGLRMIK